MPLDPSIFGQIDMQAPNKLAQIFDPAAQRAKKLEQYQQEEQLQGIEDARSLRDILRTANTQDPRQLAQKAYSAGNIRAGQEFAKQAAEQEKLKQDAEYKKLQGREIQDKLAKSAAGYAYADPSDQNFARMLTEQGVPPEQHASALASLPRDPEGRRQLLMQAHQSWESRGPKLQSVNGQLVDVNDPNNKGRVIPQQVSPEYEVGPDGKVTGMNPGVLRAKTQIAQAGANAGGVPMTILQTENGAVQVPTRGGGAAIPVIDPSTGKQAKAPAGASGKMTEDQGKATGWLAQADNAYANMMDVVTKNPAAQAPGMLEAAAGKFSDDAANALRSADRQKFTQAASSLSEALLRAATGAGVNKEEAAQKIRELTPSYLDKAAVRQQKLAAIPVYMESLKVRAGPGASMVPMKSDNQGGNVAKITTSSTNATIPSGWSVKVK